MNNLYLHSNDNYGGKFLALQLFTVVDKRHKPWLLKKLADKFMHSNTSLRIFSYENNLAVQHVNSKNSNMADCATNFVCSNIAPPQ